jgi:diamine N-acetyltransferase
VFTISQDQKVTHDPEPTIRRCGLEDAALLSELGARTFAETFAADNTPEDMAAYVATSFNLERQRAELADPASTILIATVDGAPAGYAHLLVSEPADGVVGPHPVELMRLYVSREWHGRRVGEALLRASLETAKQAGHETLWLGVWERNGRAQAFYRKWGFREVGEHDFQLGTDLQRDVVMERSVE